MIWPRGVSHHTPPGQIARVVPRVYILAAGARAGRGCLERRATRSGGPGIPSRQRTKNRNCRWLSQGLWWFPVSMRVNWGWVVPWRILWIVHFVYTKLESTILPENAPLKTISEVWIHGDSWFKNAAPICRGVATCRWSTSQTAEVIPKKATDVSRLHQCTCRCYPIFH